MENIPNTPQVNDTTPTEDDGWTPPKFATVYLVELCDGGPEEGGWWYNWYDIPTCGVISVPIVGGDKDAAHAAAADLGRKAGLTFAGDPIDCGGYTRPARSYRSAAPEADAIVLFEVEQGETVKDQQRPRYE